MRKSAIRATDGVRPGSRAASSASARSHNPASDKRGSLVEAVALRGLSGADASTRLRAAWQAVVSVLGRARHDPTSGAMAICRVGSSRTKRSRSALSFFFTPFGHALRSPSRKVSMLPWA